MPRLTWKPHPFRLLFYLELSLLAIALLAAFAPFLHHPPHPFHPHPPHLRPPGILRPIHLTSLNLRFRPGVVLSIAALGLMGLRLPFGSRLVQALYTSLGFALAWLAVLLGGRVERVFPALILVVAIRACLFFPWSGRLVVALLAYLSFLSMLLMSFFQIRPLGIPLGRPFPRRLLNLPSEFLRDVFLGFMLNSAILFGLVLIFVLLLVGALLAEKQSRQELALANRRLRQYALLIEDQATLQERNRIAREMHDSVGHSLTAQSIQLENVAMLLNQDTNKAASHLDKARQLGKQALQNVRHSVASLRNHPLQGQALDVAIAKLIKEFEANNGIVIDVQINLTSAPSNEIATALYRVIQEALTNISKHSQATQIQLSLDEINQAISLQIIDNGQGFNPSENTTGFGLQGMHERIETLGGTFWLQSQVAQGCQIQVNIPLITNEG